MKNTLLIITLLIALNGYAQKEANYWLFGCNEALTFNTGKPVILKNIKVDALRTSSSSICTPEGKLIFCLSGGYPYDSNGTLMPNYKSADHRTIQPSIIVPWPDSSHLYFVFKPGNSGGLFSYFVVNMNARGGLGDVSSEGKNISLPTFISGKVTAVAHSNKRDYWVLTPQGNSDSMHAYLVTSKGVSNQPVSSKTGIYVTAGPSYHDDYYGYFKLSPNGRKICNINRDKISMIADFDPSTGKLSNVWEFNNYGVGVEFSQKSRFLYVGNSYNTLSQYDLSAKTKTQFIASRKTIDSISSSDWIYYTSAFQLGPDGKIYIIDNDNNHFHIIHSPDSIGKKSRFERNGFLLRTANISGGHNGLPNFVTSLFHKPSFAVTQNCSRDTTFFKILETYDLDSAHWDFGDKASGALNYSKKTTDIFHSYTNSGTYKVRLISHFKNRIDTIYETFFVNYPKPYLGNDTLVCKGEYISIGPKYNFTKYQWNNGLTTKNRFVTEGTYWIKSTDFDECVSYDTITVKSIQTKSDFSILISDSCLKNNLFSFVQKTTITEDKLRETIWQISDSSISTDSSFKIVFSKSGNYKVKLISKSKFGCKDSITKNITVYPNANAFFKINNTMQCFNNHNVHLEAFSDKNNSSHEWNLGDSTLSNKIEILSKRYNKFGIYTISHIASTDKNCKDTLLKEIKILPNPTSDFNYDIACSRTPINFKYLGSKPYQQLKWFFNTEDSSHIENPTQLIPIAGQKKIKLVVINENGCSDTIIKNLVVKLQSIADFKTEDICQSDSAIFINSSVDATRYNWKFGDGKTNSLESPKHKYQITSTTTYNVTLVAIVKDGCSDSISKPITINQNPNSDFTYTQTGNTFDLKANKSGLSKYKWTFGTTDSITKITNTHTHNATIGQSKICLTVTDLSGCSSQTCSTATLSVKSFKNAIPIPIGIRIYPNPASETITIETTSDNQEYTIQLINSLGQIVLIHQSKAFNESKIYSSTVNIQHLKDGIYFIRILPYNQEDGFVYQQKIMISFDKGSNQ